MDSFNIGGRTYKVVLPDFATRDDLFSAAAREGGPGQDRRLYAALIGLCGGDPKAAGRYKGAGYDPLVYGGTVYEELRNGGVKPAEIVEIGGQLFGLVAGSLFPREQEVAEAVGN